MREHGKISLALGKFWISGLYMLGSHCTPVARKFVLVETQTWKLFRRLVQQSARLKTPICCTERVPPRSTWIQPPWLSVSQLLWAMLGHELEAELLVPPRPGPQ